MTSNTAYFRMTIVGACLVAFLLPIAGRTNSAKDVNSQLQKAIPKIRTAKTPDARYHAAEHLMAITYEKDCSGVSDNTIQALISLMDIDDDIVQMWVAAVLGEIGPRAKAAAPKLISILAVSNCMTWDHSSAATIPIALRSMGVAPPPRDCHH